MKDTATTADDIRLKNGTEKTSPVKMESFANNEEELGDAGGHEHKLRTGQGWGKGIVADVKRTILSHWKEEMTNLNGKVSLKVANITLCAPLCFLDKLATYQ